MTELPKDEIFRCQNRQLAFALAVCGAEFAPIQDGGPAANTYTIGFLRQPRFRSRFAGRGVTEAATELVNQGIPGNVTYAFKRSRVVDEVIAAWDAMARERTDADADGREPQMPNIPTAMMAQVLFVSANSTAEFAKVPFVNRMMQLGSTMDGKSREEEITEGGKALPGKRTVSEGAGKVWSIFGSQTLRDHLKV